jgi:hypothetical protein
MNRSLIVLLVMAVLSCVPSRLVDGAPTTPTTAAWLTPEESLDGWLALFDGQTTFGFRDAKLVNQGDQVTLQGGTSTTEFADYELRVQVLKEGDIELSGERMPIGVGKHVFTSRARRGPIRLGDQLVVESLSLKPLELKSLWNGRDLNGWDRRGRVPSGNPGARWSVENGVIRVVGGPEALEYAPAVGTHLFGDFLVQMTVRTRRAGTNGGFFFRNQPGKTMMGYEAQLHNSWYDPQSGKHGYTTGGIDDRQQARAPVAVDEVPFRMTVIAHGPHLATWVNGYQTVDWIDSREPDPNPRKGKRLEPGTIQFQAHDPETDFEIHGIWLRELP